MRLFRGLYGAILISAIGAPGPASAACCIAPVHVYVPPPHVVVVPHTTFIRPVTPQVHPHAAVHAPQSNPSASSAPPVAHATRTHRVEQPIVVSSQATTGARCKRDHAGDGCRKKDEEQTGWATVRHWLQLDKH